MATTQQKSNYDASQIQMLRGMEAVRENMGMYLGGNDAGALHHLVYEVVDNSVDEALAGICDTIIIEMRKDGAIAVVDNGRGIPTDMHPVEQRSALELALTELHAGGKFKGSEGYKVSGGLHGVGVSAVNAVSEWMRAEISRDDKLWVQEYRLGVPQGPVKAVGKASGTGTTIIFKPADSLFTTTEFNFKTLSNRLREMAYLTKGLRFKLIDHIGDREANYYFDGGIVSFVRHLTREKGPLLPQPFYVEKAVENVNVEVALQYTGEFNDSLLAFTNNIANPDGGTHVTGFRTALTRTINAYGRNKGLLKDGENLSGDDVREGLTAIVSVKLFRPQFESQTKVKLATPEAKSAVETVLNEALATFLDENPSEAKRIIEKGLLASRARDAARKARDLVQRKGALEGFALPGKLADCADKDPEHCELFVVEGDSAGGCFSGDTLVALADGRNATFRQLVAEQADGKQNYCYTIRHDGTVGIERIMHARITKRNATVIKVTLDNGETIVCTPDHRFMLRDGSYRAAAELTVNDPLMPLYRKHSDRTEPGVTIDGYEMVWNPHTESWLFTHMLAKSTHGANSTFDQIEYRHSVEALRGYLAQDGHLDLEAYQAHRLASRDRSLLRFDRFSERYFNSDMTRTFEAIANYNHRIVSIEQLSEQIDVYDIEVPGTHNFALASGVFVHNSAKQGRDRRFQAILPLRGKILNVEKARLDKMLANNEVKALITAMGTGIGETFDLGRLRYHRIMLMADADVDGSHIRTLLLTFFYRHMRDIIENGHLYLAQPPLFRVQHGKTYKYVFNEQARDDYIGTLPQGSRYVVQRFKGLGEMNPEQLWETTLNPQNRMLLQVTVDDARQADDTFSMLMGDSVDPRRRFINTHASDVRNLDI